MRTSSTIGVPTAAVVLGVALLAGCGGDDQATGTGADDPATTADDTAATDPEGRTATSEATPAADVPDRWVGHDPEHRLVVVDTESGEVVRVIDEFDDPEDFGGEGEPLAGGSFLGDFALTPDGSTVYFERCCEPAPGRMYRAPVEGGEPEEIGVGAFPAVSPDGSQLALVEMQWLTITDLDSDESRRIEAEGEPPVAISNPVWSPDGRSIAFERYDDGIERGGELVILDLDDGASLDDARPVAAADDRGSPTLPTFDRRGRLHAVYQNPHIATSRVEPTGTATAVVLDPDTGDVISERELDGTVEEQTHDPSGTYLIRTFGDGTVRYWDAGDTPARLADDHHAAVW